MNPDSLLARTYQLLETTNLTYRQVAEGAGVDKNWLEKFKQRVISDGAGVGKVQLVHDFLVAYEAIRAPQVPSEITGAADPKHPQSLGRPGNG